MAVVDENATKLGNKLPIFVVEPMPVSAKFSEYVAEFAVVDAESPVNEFFTPTTHENGNFVSIKSGKLLQLVRTCGFGKKRNANDAQMALPKMLSTSVQEPICAIVSVAEYCAHNDDVVAIPTLDEEKMKTCWYAPQSMFAEATMYGVPVQFCKQTSGDEIPNKCNVPVPPFETFNR